MVAHEREHNIIPKRYSYGNCQAINENNQVLPEVSYCFIRRALSRLVAHTCINLVGQSTVKLRRRNGQKLIVKYLKLIYKSTIKNWKSNSLVTYGNNKLVIINFL